MTGPALMPTGSCECLEQRMAAAIRRVVAPVVIAASPADRVLDSNSDKLAMFNA